jgi:glutaredoxin-related protein
MQPILLVLALCAFFAVSIEGFSTLSSIVRAKSGKVSSVRVNSPLKAGPAPSIDERTRERIDTLIKNNKVMLFMKGNKIFPQWCVDFKRQAIEIVYILIDSVFEISGFSNTACRILDALNSPYETFNVLEDESIRQVTPSTSISLLP